MPIVSEVLPQIGLDEKETTVYITLLDNGGLTVLDLARKSNQKRTNLYNILNVLQQHNLVQKVEEENTTKYFPNSPREIEKLMTKKETQFEMAKLNFEILVESLQSKYNLVSHKPVITYLEGLKGLQKVYDDILDTGEDIMLIRSTFDDKREDVDKLIAKQLVEQVKRGIHSKVVGPPEPDSKELFTKYDNLRLVEQHFVGEFPFDLPAQIIIYGNKTAIATIRKDIIITLIDNPEISSTFRVLFQFIWNYVKPQHERLIKTWK